MGTWKDMLKADPTNWLLEKDNPSVRYYALRDLVDLPETDAQVQTTGLDADCPGGNGRNTQ